MKYADKLRAFADYLDSHEVIDEKVDNRWEHPSLYIYVEDWAEFQRVIGDLGGYIKSGSAGSLTARHFEVTDTDETMFRISVSVSGVCEQKPKLSEDGEPIMRKKSVYVETEELEPVVEWVCPEVWSS